MGRGDVKKSVMRTQLNAKGAGEARVSKTVWDIVPTKIAKNQRLLPGAC